jgi:NTE family protein
VLGVILNALLLDAIDVDMERLIRMNGTLDHLPSQKQNELDLKRIEWHWIRPTQDIGHLASDLYEDLPRVIRYLLGGLGSSRESSELTSYLLFSPGFCSKLVEIGYNDGMSQQAEIAAFLKGEQPPSQTRLVVS